MLILCYGSFQPDAHDIFIFSVAEALLWKNGFDSMVNNTTVLTVGKYILVDNF